MEKTAARERDGAIPGSTGGGAAVAHRRRLACGTPTAEWPEPNGGTRIRRYTSEERTYFPGMSCAEVEG